MLLAQKKLDLKQVMGRTQLRVENQGGVKTKGM
jgi:hypothetical protein